MTTHQVVMNECNVVINPQDSLVVEEAEGVFRLAVTNGERLLPGLEGRQVQYVETSAMVATRNFRRAITLAIKGSAVVYLKARGESSLMVGTVFKPEHLAAALDNWTRFRATGNAIPLTTSIPPEVNRFIQHQTFLNAQMHAYCLIEEVMEAAALDRHSVTDYLETDEGLQTVVETRNRFYRFIPNTEIAEIFNYFQEMEVQAVAAPLQEAGITAYRYIVVDKNCYRLTVLREGDVQTHYDVHSPIWHHSPLEAVFSTFA